jgi:hypothetical protein
VICLLDADASLLDFKEDVNGPLIAVIPLYLDISIDCWFNRGLNCEFNFRLHVVEIELSLKLTKVLMHDLILPINRFLEHILSLSKRLTQVTTIDKP